MIHRTNREENKIHCLPWQTRTASEPIPLLPGGNGLPRPRVHERPHRVVRRPGLECPVRDLLDVEGAYVG